MDYAREIAKASLDVGAIKLNTVAPFVWASGYQMPIYNDNRLLLGSASHRGLIADAFIDIIVRENMMVDVVAGTATAGIPHATTLADTLCLPLVYVRDGFKNHGLRNQIEGVCDGLNGQKVVVIEDLISTGGSSARAVKAVRDADGVVDFLLSIFNYGMDKAVNAFDGTGPIDSDGTMLGLPCNVRSILTYNTLIDIAHEIGYIDKAQGSSLREWKADPFNWGENRGFPRIR